MTDLIGIYEEVARSWTPDELAERYRSANERGEEDLPAGDTTDQPIAHLATAVPRLISLAVAAYSLHVVPLTAAPDGAALGRELLASIDRTASGSLHRCHLALEADAQRSGYAAGEYVEAACELGGELLERLSSADEPPAVLEHAREAGRWAAIAIETLAREDSVAFAEAASDSLARLLVVWIFAEAASGRETPVPNPSAAGRGADTVRVIRHDPPKVDLG